MKEKKRKIQQSDLQGFKYFKKLSRMLNHLHLAGCQRDRAGNRLLHMDQYVTLLLLCMFSPICSSLRAMQQASELKKVKKKLRVPRCSLGSLSEAASIFDSDLLRGVVEQLADQIESVPHPEKLDDIGGILTIVDGTLLKSLPKTVDALWKDENNKAFKAHFQYEILKAVPVASELTNGRANEKTVLSAALQSGKLYVLDRGFAKYELMQQIIDAHSHFVCRISDVADYEVLEERQLDGDSLKAGVCRDMVVRLGSQPVKDDLKQKVRILQLKLTEQTEYSAITLAYRGKRRPQTMLIATDRMDLSADVIALIYRCRWQVEIFFRFFKHVLGCHHLLSHRANGVQLQVYAAIIACLLIALYTGRKPTKRTYQMLCWYLAGWADEEELTAHIERLKEQTIA